MQGVSNVSIDDNFRGRVDLLVERLDGAVSVAAGEWVELATHLGLDPASPNDAPDDAVIVVGAPATILKYAATQHREFGFVSPIARMAKPWQRAATWRDDLTLDLWNAGWTPVALDRVLVAFDGTTLEFLIGNARRTPQSA